MVAFPKPENALKRAEELINVGQKQDALQALHDIITSRRSRSWQKTLEKIMFKYVELCVELRSGRFAKDGLIQYRIACQQVNVTSLEEVIKHFMHLSTEKAEQARSQAQALEEALDIDDLEADKRPEDLMLSYVSGEKGKDRSDRELVTPWFKFLWETYRTVLEILRNNSKLEALYAMTAHRAFQFCKQYKRSTEFRRLCEIIRNHLANLNKYRDQRDRPDLSAPESLQLYLETRFEQLKIATELELWQEAFRSAEDIHGLMCMVKKTPKPSLMVVYYAKLTEIFQISASHLYHAYAWFKLFTLQKSFNKNLSQKDLQLIASSVVLASLSVLPYDHKHGASHLELQNEKDRNSRMANLIGFNVDAKLESGEALSRSNLLSELVFKGVLSCAPQEVKDLYHLLEHEFLPLDLASKTQVFLTKISNLGGRLSSAPSLPEVQLSKYIPALEKLATLRLLQQVSQVYQTLKIESLSKMIPFFEFPAVEKICVDAVKYNFISMKVDHMKGVVLFGNLGLGSEGFQDHLTVLAESLNKARAKIHPLVKKASKLGEMFPGLADLVDKEHKRLLARKSIIEKRKEQQELLLLEMERNVEVQRKKQQQIAEEEEKRRLAAEMEKRKNKTILDEIRDKETEETKALQEDVGKRHKKMVGKSVLDNLRERQEGERKLQKLVKTMDYLERAKREEAAYLIEAAFQQRLVEEKVLHEREQQLEVELSRQRHDGDLREKNRLTQMLDNKIIFQERVMRFRREEYDRRRAERDLQIQQMLQARRQEREALRKKIFYVQNEEEKQRKMHEVEEARKLEEAERQRKIDEERRAKLDEIAEKQRQREQELEEKERQRREALLRGSTNGHSGPSEPAVGSSPLEPVAAAPVAATATAPAATTTGGKYVPKFRRERAEGSGQAPPSEPRSMGW
ncbi:Eukaryotic translation initiation factor 3 subunit A [Morella rubra]|uniref:Eukaryotic translation initiation factor 3 subunit A n=1 Tax=Morella rubra TaxID=262757 RepID=A0A6A1UNU2_9ROSI|nr:Eukaryotic translation initiation factor 3 subunit A [Morella rubra]